MEELGHIGQAFDTPGIQILCRFGHILSSSSSTRSTKQVRSFASVGSVTDVFLLLDCERVCRLVGGVFSQGVLGSSVPFSPVDDRPLFFLGTSSIFIHYDDDDEEEETVPEKIIYPGSRIKLKFFCFVLADILSQLSISVLWAVGQAIQAARRSADENDRSIAG